MVQKFLHLFVESSDMDSIQQSMVYLHTQRHFQISTFFKEFSSGKARDGIRGLQVHQVHETGE
jgi:hypothetical protein